MTPEQLAALVADKEAGTPGPWRVGPVDDTVVYAADKSEVAEIDGDYNEPDLWPIMEANARRIARVPELEDAVIALTAEVARLSTPPDDAEVLVDALGVKSAMIKMGEKIAWGSETALMDKAADAITRLSHALAAIERAAYERGVRAMSDMAIGALAVPQIGTVSEIVRDVQRALLTQEGRP